MTSQLLPLLYKMTSHVVYLITGLGVVASIDFQDKVTLGSILIALLLVVFAGVFTVRSKIATIWREEAEGERAAKERLQEELAHARAERAEFEKQQAELRHHLKNEVVGLKAQVQVLEAKTDLTSAVRTIQEASEHSGQRVSDQIAHTLNELAGRTERRDEAMLSMLKEIRDKLPSSPVHVHATEPLPVHEVERRKS